MSAKEEIKKVFLTEPLKYLLGLLLPPLTALLLTALPETRDRILAAVPGGLLLALACAELVVIAGLLTYVHFLYRERRGLREKTATRPTYMFGVGWDERQNPLCPSCGTPLSSTYDGVAVIAVGRFPSTRGNPKLQCLKCCKKAVELIDDEGRELSLGEAKRKILAAASRGADN